MFWVTGQSLPDFPTVEREWVVYVIVRHSGSSSNVNKASLCVPDEHWALIHIVESFSYNLDSVHSIWRSINKDVRNLIKRTSCTRCGGRCLLP